MIPEEFERKKDLVKAIKEFLLMEEFILGNDLNERTLSHKLAEYLQKHFSDFNVDCEYNRMKGKNADNEYITKTLNLKEEEVNNSDTTGKTVYPDIIIHKRGDNKDNFLVIEIKKNKNNNNKSFDFNKLKAYTRELEYEFGIYLEFDKDKISQIKWFKNGKEIQTN
ncbi:MAG: hypothetical protein ACTSX6_05100 [Candidatus Heimdallarchaeaceae archaeon]